MKNPLGFCTAVFLLLLIHLCPMAFASAESAAAPANNAANTAVITLQNRTPQDIIPTITPFLAPGGQIKGFENQIIIQSTPDNIAAIKDIIQKIDVMPKQLMITISNGHDKPNEIMSITPSGEVTFGHDEPDGPHSVTYGTNRESDRQVSSIRVDNGQVGFINSGETVPLTTNQAAGFDNYRSNFNLNGSGPLGGQINARGRARENAAGTSQSFDYQNLSNGFYVRPELVGSQVKLELSTQNDQPLAEAGNPNKPVYTTFNAQTTMMVPLGKWVNFGGNRNQDELDQSGNVYRTGSRDQSQRFLWLRVDVIPDK